MSAPTPERLHKHELKRAAERKLQRTMTFYEWNKHKYDVRKRVIEEEREAKGLDIKKTINLKKRSKDE